MNETIKEAVGGSFTSGLPFLEGNSNLGDALRLAKSAGWRATQLLPHRQHRSNK